MANINNDLPRYAPLCAKIRCSRHSGFTLIEFVIILIIIGLLAVLPFYSLPGSVINIDAQARLFANDVRYTQSLAMAKSERYTIVGLSTTTYQIQNSAGTPITFPSGSTIATLNSDISFGTVTNLSGGLITFDGDGVPYLDTGSPGTPLVFGTVYTIQLVADTNVKTITITPITGRVTVS